jgi:hypothetical protein
MSELARLEREPKLDRQELLEEYRNTELTCFEYTAEYLWPSCLPVLRMLLLALLLESSWFCARGLIGGDLAISQAVSSLTINDESPGQPESEVFWEMSPPKPSDVVDTDEPSSNNNDEYTGSEFARSRATEVGMS